MAKSMIVEAHPFEISIFVKDTELKRVYAQNLFRYPGKMDDRELARNVLELATRYEVTEIDFFTARVGCKAYDAVARALRGDGSAIKLNHYQMVGV